MKKAIEWFILGGNAIMILLGLWWGVWEAVAFGCFTSLVGVGIPHMIDKHVE